MIFLNSGSSAAALVFYLPSVCTHIDAEGKQRKARVWNIFKNSAKTQYLMNTMYIESFFPSMNRSREIDKRKYTNIYLKEVRENVESRISSSIKENAHNRYL